MTCGVPKCENPSVSTCAFPVHRFNSWDPCAMELCSKHRNEQSFRKDTDYCPAHQMTAQQKRNTRRKTRERRFKVAHAG